MKVGTQVLRGLRPGSVRLREPMADSILHSLYMDEICPGIFLGNIDAVTTDEGREFLTYNAVTHVLSIQSTRPCMGSLDVKRKFVCINDMPDVDILQHFQECISFINEALADGKVLVHCLMGASRSSTIVTAYLMHRDKITPNEALKRVQEKHPIAEPNEGFMDMLHLFEAMGCHFLSSNLLYRQHKLGQIAPEVGAGGRLPQDMIAVDPQESTSDQSETLFKCKKCRRAVFLESSVFLHKHSPNASCTSLFVEPVKWMEPCIIMIGKISGKLPCPKCSARLGTFKWSGTKCSCGTSVTPAFQIHKNKVDKFSLETRTIRTARAETSSTCI